MSKIKVRNIDTNRYEVEILDYSPTTHIVTVVPDYTRKLVGDETRVEHLIQKSFEFLLERERNTSILRSFELSVIGRYFPEYESEIKKRF